MANDSNLIPGGHKLTLEEQSAGGIASGKARKERATMKKVLMDMLDEVADKERGLTYRQLTILGLLKGAIQGNATNYKTILETTGEIETSGSTPEVVIKVVDNTELEKAMYSGDE